MVERMRLVRYDNGSQVREALEAGTLDAVVGSGVLDPEDIQAFKTTHTSSFAVVETDPLQNRVIILNSGLSPTNDLQVRKASAFCADAGLGCVCRAPCSLRLLSAAAAVCARALCSS